MYVGTARCWLSESRQIVGNENEEKNILKFQATQWWKWNHESEEILEKALNEEIIEQFNYEGKLFVVKKESIFALTSAI